MIRIVWRRAVAEETDARAPSQGFYEIDDSEGYAPGNVHRDDLDDLLCSLKVRHEVLYLFGAIGRRLKEMRFYPLRKGS